MNRRPANGLVAEMFETVDFVTGQRKFAYERPREQRGADQRNVPMRLPAYLPTRPAGRDGRNERYVSMVVHSSKSSASRRRER